MELETHLLIARRLDYPNKEKVKKAWDLIQQISKILTALIKSLSPKSPLKLQIFLARIALTPFRLSGGI